MGRRLGLESDRLSSSWMLDGKQETEQDTDDASEDDRCVQCAWPEAAGRTLRGTLGR